VAEAALVGAEVASQVVVLVEVFLVAAALQVDGKTNYEL
jgi:hypothetical protein